MRILSLYALMISVSLLSNAQSNDSTAARTKIEAFQSRTSSLIQKEYIEIAKSKVVLVQVVKLTELNSNAGISGVVIEWGYTSMGIFVQNGRSYLDPDELQDLENSISLMTTMLAKSPPANYTEINFSTKSGFQISIFKSGNSWKIALDHKYKYKVFQLITQDDFLKILEGLKAAKLRL